METINWDQIAEASTVAPPVKMYRFEMKNGRVIVAVGVDDYDIANARADALAAEVERLRAQSTGEWRNPPTSPVNDEWFEVRVRVRYLPDQNCYKTNFGDEIGIDAFEGWRPAPPQE